jgi:hypothetical protein
MSSGFVAYRSQSGIGAAVPTQVICCTALGKPVFSTAEPMSVVAGVFWKRPIPPRTTARGPRTAPANPAICAAVPSVHEKPMRGLMYSRFGTWSLRVPNVLSMTGLNAGSFRK